MDCKTLALGWLFGFGWRMKDIDDGDDNDYDQARDDLVKNRKYGSINEKRSEGPTIFTTDIFLGPF